MSLKPVVVTALKPFEDQGRAFSPGDPVDCSPLDAVIWARKGLVTLTKRPIAHERSYATRAVEAPSSPADPPKRRRYRRRDLTADE